MSKRKQYRIMRSYHHFIIFLISKTNNKQNGVNVRLEELLGRQSKIERQMNNIGRSLASLNVAGDEANKVNSMIENTSSLAENVSAKVRRLDEARVSCCIIVVEWKLIRMKAHKITFVCIRNEFPSVSSECTI